MSKAENFQVSASLTLPKFLLALALFALIFIICMSVGSNFKVSALSLSNLKSALSGNWNFEATILYKVRFPRILMAALVGGCLAISGLIFQNILQNPLADPFLIGVSGGCALAAVLVQSMGFHNPYLLAIAAFIGGMLSMFIVEMIAMRTGKINRGVLILAGVVLNALFSAVISLILILSGSNMPKIFAWLLGSLNLPNPNLMIPLGILSLICVIVLWFYSHQLDMVSLGDFHAYHLGHDPERIKWLSIVCASILTSIAVSLSGMIGFVGMFIPHAMRFLFGFKHNYLIPMCFIAGSIVLMCTDSLVRISPTGTELPVGSLTALLGGPFFLLLLINKFKSLKAE